MPPTIIVGMDAPAGAADAAALGAVLGRLLGAGVVTLGLEEALACEDALLVVANAPDALVGTRGARHAGARRALLQARRPLAFAPKDYAVCAQGDPRVIGAGFDGEAAAAEATTAAALLADAAGAALRVYAYSAAAPLHAGSPVFAGQTAKQRLERRLAELLETLPPGARTLAGVAVGDPVEELVKRSGEVDLLVLGAHHHGLLDRLVVAMVGPEVVHRAQCPVLSFPAGTSAAFTDALRAPAVRPRPTPA